MRRSLIILLFAALLAPLSRPARATDLPAGPALVVAVSAGGIQRLSGAALAAAGLDLSVARPDQLWLWRRGVAVPVELRDGGDGRLDPGDELRFYAPPPGDRWNLRDFYWLAVGAGPAPSIAVRQVAPGAADERTDARERGLLYAPAHYDSRRPGPDGDRWFAADLRAEPGASDAVVFALSPTLPPAAGQTVITVDGQLYTGAGASLALGLEGATSGVGLSRAGLWSHELSLAGTATTLQVTLTASIGPAGTLLDRLRWERPAGLRFGGRGAEFTGVPGRWRYTLSDLPPAWELYDVTQPDSPQRLEPGPGQTSFEDGPEPRTYLVAGPGTLHTPSVAPSRAADLGALRGADAVYIAPEALLPALAPLLAHREAQGHQAVAVAVEAIYDGWGWGAVDPEAIRAFLRHAAATWERPPSAVVLVGDGSSDPHDWTARGAANVNLIPPYLADVDPWLGEAACDGCYARLGADDPRQDALPDMAVGRLPVKSAAELAALVEKLIGYDTAPAGGAWRSTVALLADDPDSAGDFLAASEALGAQMPDGIVLRRAYYDPTGERGAASAVEASALARAAFDEGAGVLVYTGHSHQWQWALTDPGAERSWLLGLYEPDGLANAGRLPVVAAMSCLSSAFQTPAISGTTVNERLVLARGGAVAVWGPAGLGVAHGHDLLQRGFFWALWSAPPGTATLGALTRASLSELAAEGGADDTLFTYVLLGDPLTQVRAAPAYRLALPLLAR